MKKIFLSFLILGLFFPKQIWSQQYLFKVSLSDETRQGYGVTMFYIANSLSDLASRFNQVTSISEATVLNVFTTPVVEPRSSEGPCSLSDTLNLTLENIFKKSNVINTIRLKNGSLSIVLEFFSGKFSYCVFPLDYKYWASYADANKMAATIISIPLYLKFSDQELNLTRKLERSLKKNK